VLGLGAQLVSAMRSEGLLLGAAGPEQEAPPLGMYGGECEIAQIVGSKPLGCGTEACAWEATTSQGQDVVIKVAKEGKGAGLTSECKIAQQMMEAGITGTLQCLGVYDNKARTDHPIATAALVFSPLLRGAVESGLHSKIDLGDKTQAAATRIVDIAFQMLSHGFVNVDQANNILFHPQSGEPLFIDFGHAFRGTKAYMSKRMSPKLVPGQVLSMLSDLFVTIMPDALVCKVAALAKAQLEELKSLASAAGQDEPVKLLLPHVVNAFEDGRTGLGAVWQRRGCA